MIPKKRAKTNAARNDHAVREKKSKAPKAKKPGSENIQVTVDIGDARIAKKILGSSSGIIGSLQELFGVGTKATKKLAHSNSGPFGKTIHQLTIVSASPEGCELAKEGLTLVVEKIKADEQAIFDSMMQAPKKHTKKVELLLTDKEHFEVKASLDTAYQMIQIDTKKKVDSYKPKENELPSQSHMLSVHGMMSVKKSLEFAKNAAPGIKDVASVIELLNNIYAAVPMQDDGDLGDDTEYQATLIGIRKILEKTTDTPLINLSGRMTKHNADQAALTTAAKNQFSPEEREERRTAIKKAVDNKRARLTDDEMELLENNVFRAINDAQIPKDEARDIVKSVIPLTEQQQQEKVAAAEKAQKMLAYKEYALYDGRYVPQTESQVEQVKAMRENGLTIVVGDAGTGKSMAAMAYALERLKKEKKKILILRPMKELGAQETLGYLPGGELEKIGPGFRPILKNLLKIEKDRGQLKKWLGLDKKAEGKNAPSILDSLIPDQDILIMPMAYIRGDTFDNYTIIVEEAQNLTLMEAEAIVTRAGEGTKIILAGDKIQTDLPTKDRQGRWLDERSMPALPLMLDQAEENKDWMGVVIHPAKYIVRSALAKKAVGLFSSIRENKTDVYKRAFHGWDENTGSIVTKPSNGNGHSNDNGYDKRINERLAHSG